MAIITVPDLNLSLTDFGSITKHLSTIGIQYERWEPACAVAPGAPANDTLDAYASEIERLMKSGGYVTADVIDVSPLTAGLDEMLARFNREHWHNEDEVRMIVSGRGLFHIRPREGLVTAIEVHSGDLLRVPRGTWHWFNLCREREIRAIRLFQDPAGWTPYYTESGVDSNYQPLCFGLAHIAPQTNLSQ